jgi:hypothetical protein
MTSNQRVLANDSLYRRIDEMRMSVTDREIAKAQMWAGERIADGVCEFLDAVRSGAAHVARHVRNARAASPQH